MLDKLSKNTNFKSKKVQLAVLTFLLVSLPFFVLLAGKEIKTRLKAAPGAELTITPTDLTQGTTNWEASFDQQFSTLITIDTGDQNIDGVEAHISYDPSVVNIAKGADPANPYADTFKCSGEGNPQVGDFFPNNYFRTVDKDAQGNETGHALIVCHRFSLSDLGQTKQTAPANTVNPVVEVQFQVVAQQERQNARIGFTVDANNQERSIAVQATPANTCCGTVNILDATHGFNFDVSLIQSAGSASLALSPASGTYNVGDQFDVNVLLDTGTSQVDSVDAVINYDTTVLNAVNITKGAIFNKYVMNPDPSGIDDAAGRIEVTGQIGTATTPVPVSGSNLVFATITFEATQQTNAAQINFDFTYGDRNDSNVVYGGTDILDQVVNGAYIFTAIPTPTSIPPTNTPTPIPTVTPIPTNTPTPIPTVGPNTPTPTSLPPTNTPIPTATPIPPTSTPTTPVLPPKLTFILKLQGRNWAGATNSRGIRFYIPSSAYDLINAIGFNTDQFGQYAGSDLTNLTPGTYDLLIKPRGYLQKRISKDLISGDNTIDLISAEFSAGDIYPYNENDSNDLQTFGDNIINSLDYNRLLLNFKQVDNLADLDGSGQVNSLDFSLMLSNWNRQGNQ